MNPNSSTVLILRLIYFSVIFMKGLGFSNGFVLQSQVDLPEPKLTELSQISQLTQFEPKLVKAVYEVTYSVERNTNYLDSKFLTGRAVSVDTKLVTHRPPTVIKVEAVTDSLVKKDEDEVPIIKGYDPDAVKHLADSLDDIKKQTDLKVNLSNPQGNYQDRGWSSSWRPIARSDDRMDRVPYYRDYRPPPPCCLEEPRRRIPY